MKNKKRHIHIYMYLCDSMFFKCKTIERSSVCTSKDLLSLLPETRLKGNQWVMNPLIRTHRWPLLRPPARRRLSRVSSTLNCSMLFHGPSVRPLLNPSNGFDVDSTCSYHGSTWCSSQSFQVSPTIQSPEVTLDETEIKAASAPALSM